MPPTPNDAAHTRASVPSLQRVYGADHTREVAPQMGAEDFAVFAERVPALYVKMGVRNEARGITAMIHTEDFDIDEAVLPMGVQRGGHPRLRPPRPRRGGRGARPLGRDRRLSAASAGSTVASWSLYWSW